MHAVVGTWMWPGWALWGTPMQTCPGDLGRLSIVPWSSGMTALQCLLSIFVGFSFCKSFNLWCSDTHPLSSYNGHFSPCSMLIFLLFFFLFFFDSFSRIVTYFCDFPTPFPSSLFSSVLTLSPHYISHFPVALVPVGEESVSPVNASVKRSPPLQSGIRESSFCIRHFFVCLCIFFRFWLDFLLQDASSASKVHGHSGGEEWKWVAPREPLQRSVQLEQHFCNVWVDGSE